jgi:uncharacterized membrane protein YbhN (UPF0104 family)
MPLRALALVIVPTVLLYVGMVTLADWPAFHQAVSALPAALWEQVVALSLLSYLLRFARWHGFLTALGHRIPLLRDLEIYLAAFALTLTPGKAGETVRSVYLHPFGVPYAHSLGTFVAERLMDLLAVGFLALMAISSLPEYWLWLVGALACCLTAALLLRSRLLALAAKKLAKGALAQHAASGVTTIGFLLSGRRLAWAAPVSLLAWTAQGVSLYLIVQALGHDLPLITLVAIYCLSILAGAASFIPGGLGATEAAIALLLTAAGMDPTDAITASLISRGLTLWLAVGIGVGAMARLALAKQQPRRMD